MGDQKRRAAGVCEQNHLIAQADEPSLYVWKVTFTPFSCFCACSPTMPAATASDLVVSDSKGSVLLNAASPISKASRPSLTAANQEGRGVPTILVTPVGNTSPGAGKLRERIFLTGLWAEWRLDDPKAKMEVVPGATAGRIRLRFCAKLTSATFSFQVVSPDVKPEWSWRLFPRDAQVTIKNTHVCREALLKRGEANIEVGVGNLHRGHGLNFHILDEAQPIVTIYVEVPVRFDAHTDATVLVTDVEDGAKVWYEVKDTGAMCSAGDNVDITQYPLYKKMGLA